MTNCFKFGEMQTIFKDKGRKVTLGNKPIAKVKVVIALKNMVDVHVTTLIGKPLKNKCLRIENHKRTNCANGLGSKKKVEKIHGKNHTTRCM